MHHRLVIDTFAIREKNSPVTQGGTQKIFLPGYSIFLTYPMPVFFAACYNHF